MQLEDEIVRRVVDHADLLEHDLPLERQIGCRAAAAGTQIGDDVGRLRQVLVEHARLKRRVLARGVRVERAAERLERQRDVLRATRARVPLNTMCSSMCETPIRSRVSWIEAARTHAPNATDRTPGMVSESTVSPFGSVERRSAGARRVSTRASLARRDLRGHRARHAPRTTRTITTLRDSPTPRSSVLACAAYDGSSPSPAAAPIGSRDRDRRGRRARGAAPTRYRHLRRLAFRLRQQRLHRQPQASALVAIEELDLHAVALLDHVLGLLGAAVLQLGDVEQRLRCPA